MSTAFGSFLESRFDPSPRTLLLAAGDLLLITLFVAMGEVSHGGGVADGIGALIPFLLGWAVAASLLGAYSARALASIRGAAAVAAGSWIVGALIGQGLRATPVFPGDAALTFVLVSLGVGLALLVPWRVLMAYRG